MKVTLHRHPDCLGGFYPPETFDNVASFNYCCCDLDLIYLDGREQRVRASDMLCISAE